MSILKLFRAVVLNRGSENHMRLANILCAAFSSLSITPLIFCVTDLVLQRNKTCQLTCVKIFLVRLSNKVVGLDMAPCSEKVENR